MAAVPSAFGLGSLSIGYESRHIYRGVDSALDGPIQWSSIQLAEAGWYGGLWYGTGPTTDYEEVDLFGGYVFQTGEWRIIPNFIWYHFPENDAADSTDVQIWFERDLSLDNGWTMVPQVKLSYNIDVEGTYLEAGLAFSRDLGEGWHVSVRPAIAYSSDLRPDDGLDHAEVIATLGYMVTETFGVTALAGYSASLDALDQLPDEETWIAVSASVRF